MMIEKVKIKSNMSQWPGDLRAKKKKKWKDEALAFNVIRNPLIVTRLEERVAAGALVLAINPTHSVISAPPLRYDMAL
jgi:hypothetical protein